MDKLQWCRENAPDALKNLSDEELLEEMSLAWEKYGKDICDESAAGNDTESSLATQGEKLDYMVSMLVREFGEELAFKGGYMLTKMMPDVARQTTDIDFSIDDGGRYTDIKQALSKIGDSLIGLGVISRYVLKDTIAPTMSGGMSMYDNNGQNILGVNVGWHKTAYGTAKTDIAVVPLRAFTVERMVCDKVSAILSKKRFRRPKDIYDLYFISMKFDYDLSKVREYINIRTDGAGAEWGNYPFNDIVRREYVKAYDKLQVRSVVTNDLLSKPEFKEVLYTFELICNGLLNENYTRWNHDTKRCEMG